MKGWGKVIGWMVGIAATACLAAEPAPIAVTIYADAGYPPYSYVDGGKAAGVYAEIMRRAFARMPRYAVTIEPAPWKRGLALLASGQGFALSPPYRRPQERPWMTPYSEPVLEETVVVVCRDQVLKKPRLLWPDDYAGLVIGSNSGFQVVGEAFRMAVAQGKLAYEEAGTSQQNILKLVAGRIDCYVNDRVSIRWEYERLRQRGGVTRNFAGALVEAAVVSRESGYLGFGAGDDKRFPFRNDFLREFNDAIRTLRGSGEIARIVETFLAP